jgi:hypothetical protein
MPPTDPTLATPVPATAPVSPVTPAEGERFSAPGGGL